MIPWIKSIYRRVKFVLSPHGREYFRYLERTKKADKNLGNVLGTVCSQLVDREVSSDIGKKYSIAAGPYFYGVEAKLDKALRMEENGMVYYVDTFYVSLKELYSKGFKVRALGADDGSLEKTKLLQEQQELVKKFIQQ